MMKGGLGNIMKQAQKMQEDLQKAQAELAGIEVTGVAGGDMVKVVMNCKHQVRSVSIDNTLVGEDKDMLEDLVAAAINDATRKVEQATQEKMSGLTAGLPGGLNLPF
ncbi:MAG: YbaB/EbfC family nucleoid-associated protein [Gammaproteobacteria bacterium]|nr:YbaB/EbfC family nucleoid-associated protein [Gammaproteobacteria bacterium]